MNDAHNNDSLENKVNDNKIEFGINPSNSVSSKDKKQSKRNLIILSIAGLLILFLLIGLFYFILHHFNNETKIEDEAINFSKVAQDNSIESQQTKLSQTATDEDNQADDDDEETEDNQSDDEKTEDDTTTEKPEDSKLAASPQPTKPPIIYEYALDDESRQTNSASANSTAEETSKTSTNGTSDHANLANSSAKVMYAGSKNPNSSAGIDSIPPSFRISKGHNILCTLQTKIDTSYPGITTCLIAKPVYSDDGKLVLIEKGSLVTGEQASDLKGTSRAFVTWNEIKTPNNIVIRVDSPMGDSLGATGIEGKINRQTLNKFFLGTMISVIKRTEDYLVNRHKKENSVVTINNGDMTNDQTDQLNQLSENLNQEFVEKKTLVVNPGTLVNIQLVRDLDFSSVYEKL